MVHKRSHLNFPETKRYFNRCHTAVFTDGSSGGGGGGGGGGGRWGVRTRESKLTFSRPNNVYYLSLICQTDI